MLEPDFFLAGLQDLNVKEKMCDICRDDTPATARCSECADYLCQKCHEMHGRIKSTRNHQVLLIADITPEMLREIHQKYPVFCKQHDSEALCYFCLSCDEAICRECKLNGHEKHETVKLQVAAKTDREIVKAMYHKGITKLKEMETSKTGLDSYKGIIADKQRELSDQIKTRCDELHILIDDMSNSIIAKLNDVYASERNQTDGENTRINQNASAMRNICETSHSLLERGNDAEIVILKKKLEERIKVLESTECIEADIQQQLKFWKFQPGSSDKKDISELFGEFCVSHIVTRGILMSSFNVPLESNIQAFYGPLNGIAVVQGFIVIADTFLNRLRVLTIDGELEPDSPFSKHEFGSLQDIAAFRDGGLVATDRQAKIIFVFDANGEVLRKIESTNGDPCGVAVNTWYHIIVAHNFYNCVEVYDSNTGAVIRKLSYLNSPLYVAVSPDNTIAVSESTNHCVKVFNPTGKHTCTYGMVGVGRGQFQYPLGIAFDTHGHILIADHANNRLHLLAAHGRFKCFVVNFEHGLQHPHAITFSEEGHIIVTERQGAVKTFKYMQ
ncbi:unnamed protein product [Owenia fusiformis]|uniref:Uncharacterized protein n=1 Tax=Owenia fusiformis TaxID=6347 RepID=A0A8J1XYH9_OWEFU|nr:unnamed protein product [Owenia fusiformis]